MQQRSHPRSQLNARSQSRSSSQSPPQSPPQQQRVKAKVTPTQLVNLIALDDALPHKISTYEDLYCEYLYSVMRKAFPWSKKFRGGMIIIYRELGPTPVCKMLMVQQSTPRILPSDYFKTHTTAYRGFPKGSYESYDKSLLQTAIRETKEETGISIIGNSMLFTSAIIIPRPELGLEETHVYFISIFDTLPDVCVDGEEIVGYEWIDLGRNSREITDVSVPTFCVLRFLEQVDFWNIMPQIDTY